jgi:hypothetical protein
MIKLAENRNEKIMIQIGYRSCPRTLTHMLVDAVISIKQSPELKGHPFLLMSNEFNLF